MADDPMGTLEDVFEFMGLDFIDEKKKRVSVSRNDAYRGSFSVRDT